MSGFPENIDGTDLMKLMIVDDHAGVRDLIRKLLATPGDCLLECATGDEAVARAQDFHPDWVTMDVRMPGRSGIETARAIRRVCPTAQVVMVTSYDQPFLRESAKEVGAAAYVLKDNLAELPTVMKHCSITAMPEAEAAGSERDGAPTSAQHLEHLRQLIESSQDILVEMTREGRILYISANVERVLGFAPEELVGTMVFDRIHPDDLPQVLAQMPLPEGWATCRFRLKDDSWRWLETSGRDFTLSDGTVHAALIVRDVTRNKQTETAFFENQRRHATLLSNLPGVVYRCRNDEDWTMEFISEGCFELTGYGVESFLKHHAVCFGELIVPVDREMVWNGVQAGLAQHRPFELTYRLRTIGGAEKWVWERGQGVYSHQGEVLAIEGFITDITAQRRTEQALRESEEKFSKAFRASPGAMSIADLETGDFLDVNDGFIRMFGHAREEIIGRSALRLGIWVNDEDRHRFLGKLFSHGSVRDLEFVGLAKDGNQLTCLVNAELVEVAGRKCVVSSMYDVTEQRESEKTRASLEAQLRQAQKLEAVGTLAGGIAHDFNNILAAVIAYTELACLDAEQPEAVRGHLAQVTQACARAKDLVRQILAFSRRQKQERRPIQPHLIVKEALRLLRSTVPASTHVSACVDVHTPAVLADPTQLHQIVMNLCTNAIHALRHRRGELGVALAGYRVDEALAQQTPGLRPGDYVRLTVSDTGVGMDAEVIKHIFEPFFTTKPPGEGTGLGLSVVHGIVKEHEGAITVRSLPGQGTTFHVFLPVCSIIDPPHQSDVRLPDPKVRARILFVDDEPGICSVARKIFERVGYQATTVTNPDEALAEFTAAPDAYDLVIADLAMPRMTGVEFARHVLRLRPQKPVLLLSGFCGEWTTEKVRELGIRDLIHKPMTMIEMTEAVARTLPAEK